jgi:hypothetical protein
MHGQQNKRYTVRKTKDARSAKQKIELRISWKTVFQILKTNFLRFIENKGLLLPSYAILCQTNPLHANLSYL